MIKAIKLYTGEDNHSHFITGTVAEGLLHEAATVRFQESPPHSFYDWHNAPTEQYVISLTGTLEFETRTGEKFILNPGEVLIALDTTGTAHKWRMIDDDPWRRVYVAFDKDAPINFVPDKA
ncbi:hypothetical protein DJ568_14310 [Mucilaginibacter hurinus]|uniref:AraC-type arabinose-binding/dimerisation domain-containing protein n=1 Tax=Mucilaginibacter hurinus TaxID=2201324 RepID=A0A367GLZ1_9SPHI|nr:hypothetical protein [Mucilaginibacter hurinus]RCH54055.1 hypothetical protein DJ568_14310 [Mucilaginibacter hurinus]